MPSLVRAALARLTRPSYLQSGINLRGKPDMDLNLTAATSRPVRKKTHARLYLARQSQLVHS
jgi:hypothetical protein